MPLFNYKTKRDRADVLFSNYIRERDNWHCVYRKMCTGNIDFRENKAGLHCSHLFGRAKRTVRFDVDNCDSACFKCHAYYEDHKPELEEWKKERIGEKRFNQLLLRANFTGGQKMDKKYELMYVKELIKQFPNK